MVAPHYFENGFHLIKRFNKCIFCGRANGAVAQFAGHNAFLRWKAVQDASVPSSMKPMERASFASRPTSRMSLTPEEGVSLTVVDEISRWQECAYGCDEIIFNLIIKWWRHGPVGKQLREFMQYAAPVHYKTGMSAMSAYMLSYCSCFFLNILRDSYIFRVGHMPPQPSERHSTRAQCLSLTVTTCTRLNSCLCCRVPCFG
ncbi:hypothetical protein GYMLUDRAFT_612202 [Collybiopsis luxurians FD-317 M1]|uniref:Glycosyltransferase 2-like domain-containing protein n=1 Tax=Collybiopsis luxurians FD-317 M1 TaxID=944289 RepID=A0A0D0CC72_9AGAR|nr:hypothetical protein GYMLUDRAFT_612202 [Collybiopsis luxurians FD-317 M1]